MSWLVQDKWSSIQDRTRAIQEAFDQERHRKAEEASQRHAQQTARYDDLVCWAAAACNKLDCRLSPTGLSRVMSAAHHHQRDKASTEPLSSSDP